MPLKPASFRPPWQQSRQQQVRDYDARRGSARERGYGSRWDRASAAFKREHPLCLGCQAMGWVEPTTVTDHVKPHQGDMVLFWDRSLWQPACDWHHSVVKQRLETLFHQGRLTIADLHLDSPKALEIARELQGMGGG